MPFDFEKFTEPGLIWNPEKNETDAMIKDKMKAWYDKYQKRKEQKEQNQNYLPENIDAESYEKWLQNVLTGQLDYERNLDYMYREQSFNAMEAEKNRDWQEHMSNTSFQRQAEDLRQAGFNPALITGLSGATTPVGSSAVSTSKQSVNTGDSYTKLLSQITSNQSEITKQVISSLGQVVSALGSEIIRSKTSKDITAFKQKGYDIKVLQDYLNY